MASHVSSLAEPRNRRIVAIVALCAVAAAGAVVGATLLEVRGQTTTVPDAVTAPRSGPPVLQLEFGLRRDPEARALSQAETLLDHPPGEPAQAAAIFGRYHSLDAQLGLLFATWHGPSSLPAVQRLAAAHPHDPAAQLNLGWADYQAGRNAAAAAAWQQVARAHPDSAWGVDAEYNLYAKKGDPPGLPPLVLSVPVPGAITAQALAALRRAAAKPDARAKLVYGWALWSLERPLSAERELAAAARLEPHDALARTAAAVGLFSWKDPRRAFGHLGPLTAVFPHSPVVEFHLGVLLLYIDERAKAAEQLRAAVANGPQTPYANDARQLLAGLSK